MVTEPDRPGRSLENLAGDRTALDETGGGLPAVKRWRHR
jgi:hypothetical protein